MGGAPLHGTGDVTGGDCGSDRRLRYADIDRLLIRSQVLRRILIDEAFLIPDDLLSVSGLHFEDAAVDLRHSRGAHGQAQVFAGCNLAVFGDMCRCPPIPFVAVSFLAPMSRERMQVALTVLDISWANDADSINFVLELTQPMRVGERQSWVSDGTSPRGALEKFSVEMKTVPPIDFK